MTKSRTIIRNLRILTTNGDQSPHVVAGDLVIAGNRVESIVTGTDHSSKAGAADGEIIDGSGHLAIPGLINAHTHAAMGFFRGLGHGRVDMIENFLFPAEKSLTPDLLEPLSWSYLVACLRAGVTCISDHYYMIAGVGQALERLGMRGFIGETIADLGGAFPGWDSWKRAREAIDEWPFGELVQPVVAPHAADTVSAKMLREAAQFARNRKLTLHMHLSQTHGELQRVKAQDNMTPVQKAFACGALSDRTLAVHMISAREADFAEIRNAGATVVICPASQMIYERLAPLDHIASTGVQWAVATDCAASNDGADVLGDCKLLGLMARDRKIDGLAFPADSLFSGITTVPARALGMAGQLGVIMPGSLADIVLVRDDMSMRPHGHEVQNLIYSAGAAGVEHVMINGKWRLWKRALVGLNEAQLAAEFDRAVSEITRRTGIKK